MTVREELEYQEHRRLNPLAAFADQSSGRPRPEVPSETTCAPATSGIMTALSTASPFAD